MATRAEPAQAVSPERRPELDAIRVLVVIGLVFFHSALVFAAGDDFHVSAERGRPASCSGCG